MAGGTGKRRGLGRDGAHALAPESFSEEDAVSRSSGSRKTRWFISSAAAKAGKKRIGPFERKQEAQLLVDLGKLQQRVSKGQLKEEKKIQQAIGRLRERYPRVARYYAHRV